MFLLFAYSILLVLTETASSIQARNDTLKKKSMQIVSAVSRYSLIVAAVGFFGGKRVLLNMGSHPFGYNCLFLVFIQL